MRVLEVPRLVVRLKLIHHLVQPVVPPVGPRLIPADPHRAAHRADPFALGKRLNNGGEPRRFGQGVGIDERDQRSLRLEQGTVSGVGQAGLLLSA